MDTFNNSKDKTWQLTYLIQHFPLSQIRWIIFLLKLWIIYSIIMIILYEK